MVVQSKSDKERLKIINDKCQALIEALLKDEDNKYCVDCDAKSPRWASWNLGIFLCIRCAGIHRNLGVHISRVKSVNLDSWTPEHVAYIQRMGNSRARAIYEANLPDNFRRPQTDSALESFIRAKYEHKKYIAQGWTDPSPPAPAFDVEDELRKIKEQKRQKSRTSGGSLSQPPTASSSLPRPSETSSSSETGRKASATTTAESIQFGLKSVAASVAASNNQQKQAQTSQQADLLGIDLGSSITSNNKSSLLDGLDVAKTSDHQKSSASDDLFGIFDSNNQVQSLNSSGVDIFSSPSISNSSSGAAFTGGVATNEKKVLTKESILSLYSTPLSSSAGPDPFGMNTTNSPAQFYTFSANPTSSSAITGTNFLMPNSSSMQQLSSIQIGGSPSHQPQPNLNGLGSLNSNFDGLGSGLGSVAVASSVGGVQQLNKASNTKSIDDIFSGLDILGKQKQQQVPRNDFFNDITSKSTNQSNPPAPKQPVINPFLSRS